MNSIQKMWVTTLLVLISSAPIFAGFPGGQQGAPGGPPGDIADPNVQFSFIQPSNTEGATRGVPGRTAPNNFADVLGGQQQRTTFQGFVDQIPTPTITHAPSEEEPASQMDEPITEEPLAMEQPIEETTEVADVLGGQQQRATFQGFVDQIPTPTTTQAPSEEEPASQMDEPVTEEPLTMEQPIEETTEVADVYLNFENATLSSVVNYLSEQRKYNVIPHKNLENVRVSLTTRNPLTMTRAWNVLLTLLDMNGYAIVKVNDIYRIIPTNQSKQEPIPLFSSRKGVEPEQLPDTDELIRYVYFFQNAHAQQMQGILGRMLADKSVVINRDLEAVIITEKSMSIKSAMRIVKELDIGGLRESIKILRLEHADANQIAKLFQTIMGDKTQQESIRFITADKTKESTYFSASTKIIPDEMKNSLILLGTEENMNRIIEFIQKHLDREPDAAESRLHIKEIKYASAAKLKSILDSVIRPPAGQKKEKTAVIGKFKFFEDVIIAAETPSSGEGTLRGSGNRLIVACNRDDWKRLEEFIDTLDKPEPQIALEVMIVDVTDELNRELGAQIRNKDGWLGKGVCGETMHLASDKSSELICDRNLIGVATGSSDLGTYATLGNAKEGEEGNIWGVIKAVLGNNTANIISQPFLVTNNGEESMVEVSSIQRVAGRINDPSKAGGSRTRDIEEMPAKTVVKLKPRMNKYGIVNLQIEVEISEFQETLTETQQPKTSDRYLRTQATMGTGEVLILGGLTRDEIRETRRKTPILGDIPLLGNFFRQKGLDTIKTNLYLFIRPSVIKPIFEGKPDDYTELKLAYAKYQILGVDNYLKIKDPIQRWFFKPRDMTIKKKLSDLAAGRFRKIDDFTQGKDHPKSVNMHRDSYYKTSEELKKFHEKEKAKKELIMAKLKKRKQRALAQKQSATHGNAGGLSALHSFAMKS